LILFAVNSKIADDIYEQVNEHQPNRTL